MNPQPKGNRDRDNLKRGQLAKEEEQMDALQKTRGIRKDYRRMNDLFREKASKDLFHVAQAKAILAGDDPKSLREAKELPKWPEWECTIKSELDRLHTKGTWRLVETPEDAIPLTNKWVFAKKYRRGGELLKYKGRLVVKGCAQRPGFDYVETFSPVVRLETLRVILSLSALKWLEIGQLDVKGAYLNRTLKERVYMRQPEGYEDGTKRSCQLIKTLYSLKQSGQEWNIGLNNKLRKHDFRRLILDACIYTWKEEDNLEIITIWVDNLMLFATSKE
jgi:hypothetical protein